MKFSYKLIKKLLKGVKNKKQVLDALNYYSYEVEDLEGDVFDVKIPANRFSDSASHIGIARELSASLNLNFNFSPQFLLKGKSKPDFKVEVKEKNLCPRYMALRISGVKVSSSPKWIEDILLDCGIRPINNLVDIVNYVMLLVGEPMHVFDFEKLKGRKIIVRKAKRGEKILTLDGEEISLTPEILVIADENDPVAIAGIKGGKETGVDENTKEILVEAANFEPSLIYKTYKKIGLPTDAALRFSHSLSLNLIPFALYEAASLFKEIAGGKILSVFDSLGGKEVKEKRAIEFNVEKFNSFIGVKISKEEGDKYLQRLGFKNIKKNIWLTPDFRLDLENEEDLYEEVARLYGYNFIKPQTPYIQLSPSYKDEEGSVYLREKIENILEGWGVYQTFNYSFIGEKDLLSSGYKKEDLFELKNYISEEFKYLRPNLEINLKKTAFYNLKFFDEVKIFEIGNVFFKKGNNKEKTLLGIVFASKKNNNFFELKGILSAMLLNLGVLDFRYEDKGSFLEIESKGKILGFLKGEKKEGIYLSVAELGFDEILYVSQEELEVKEVPRFPLVIRDISFWVKKDLRIGEIMEKVSLVDDYIEDVDLIDEYFGRSEEGGEEKQSLTLRFVLNPKDHTFSNEEVNNILNKITKTLKENFNAEIR
jgi:phenylalanyl-tRNA synthetase beta chain